MSHDKWGDIGKIAEAIPSQARFPKVGFYCGNMTANYHNHQHYCEIQNQNLSWI